MELKKTLLILAMLFWICGAVSFVVSMVAVRWMSFYVGGLRAINYNLFQECKLQICNQQGWKYGRNVDEVPMEIFIPRILMLTGGGMAALGLLSVMLKISRDSTPSYFTSGFIIASAGILILTASCVFTGFSEPKTRGLFPYSFDFCLHFAFTAGALFSLAGTLLCALNK